MDAGVSSSEAIQRIADHLPASAVKNTLTQAAAATEDGMAPDRALSRAFPQFGSMISGAGIALPARLAQLGEHLQRTHVLTRRLSAMAFYPAAVAVGAVVLAIALKVAFNLLLDLMASSWAGPNHVLLSFFFWLMLVIAAILCLTTAFATVRGVAPLWVKLLPGGKMWELMATARFMALYALHRDPEGGGLGPVEALAASSEALEWFRKKKVVTAAGEGASAEEALLRCGLPRDESAALVLGERSGEVVRVAREEANRLEQLSAEAADLLIRTTGHALLILAGVAVLMLYLSLYFGPVFQNTMQLSGGW